MLASFASNDPEGQQYQYATSWSIWAAVLFSPDYMRRLCGQTCLMKGVLDGCGALLKVDLSWPCRQPPTSASSFGQLLSITPFIGLLHHYYLLPCHSQADSAHGQAFFGFHREEGGCGGGVFS